MLKIIAMLTPSNEHQNLSSLWANNDALKKSEFKENLVYTPKTTISNILDKKQRKRKFIWFSPPYSLNVKSTIGRYLQVCQRNIFRKRTSYTRFQ